MLTGHGTGRLQHTVLLGVHRALGPVCAGVLPARHLLPPSEAHPPDASREAAPLPRVSFAAAT